MKNAYLVLCIWLLAGCAGTSNVQKNTFAADRFENVKVVSVYDGDTFRVNLNCTLDIFCQNIPVRVRGIDTPELNSSSQNERKKANEAKYFTTEFLRGRSDVTLFNCGRDKYFRLLCRVKVGNKDLTTALLKAGLGVAYEGGTKTSFSE